ncbi:MAG: hypothetical protein DCF22_09505 [Leptolyngbya sp.]|nr:MAG: hypothetical protein DCF22_09505 [Leptolyngbya sp.]
MSLCQGIKVISIAALFSAIALVDFATLIQPTSALPTGSNVMAAGRRRLSFRTGVRPSLYRVGGFSRGSECGNQQTLTAVVPPSAQNAAVDKTTATHPTFFVYLPSLPVGNAQFTLQDEAGGKELYNVNFKVTGKPGIVGISLPSSAPDLQVGQKYFWQMAVACDVNQPSKLSSISSWVERVAPPVAAKDDRISTLAEQGIWYDVVTLVALQRYQKPDDRAAAEDWEALMQDAGLPQFKQSAIVQIVKK